jgi:hypothetical protein
VVHGQGKDQRENQQASRWYGGKQNLLLAVSSPPCNKQGRRNPSFCYGDCEQLIRRVGNPVLRRGLDFFRFAKRSLA